MNKTTERFTARVTPTIHQYSRGPLLEYTVEVDGLGFVAFDDTSYTGPYRAHSLIDAEVEAKALITNKTGLADFEVRIVPRDYTPAVTEPFSIHSLSDRPGAGPRTRYFWDATMGGLTPAPISAVDGAIEPWGAETTLVFTAQARRGDRVLTSRVPRESFEGRRIEAIVAHELNLPYLAYANDRHDPYHCLPGTPGATAGPPYSN